MGRTNKTRIKYQIEDINNYSRLNLCTTHAAFMYMCGDPQADPPIPIWLIATKGQNKSCKKWKQAAESELEYQGGPSELFLSSQNRIGEPQPKIKDEKGGMRKY